MIKQRPNGRWFVDIEPVRGRRYRRTFDTKAEAMRFEALKIAEYSDPNKRPALKEYRTLSLLIEDWYFLHGQTLSDGVRRKNILLQLAQDLGNPLAIKLTSAAFTRYRSNALKAGVSGKTLNNRLGYLRSVYNELIRLDDFHHQNPLTKIKPLKLQEKALSYLTLDEIPLLFSALKKYCEQPHSAMVAEICLATGARWGEAQALTPEVVRDGRVTFQNTKSKKTRSIPVSKTLFKRIHHHFEQHGLFTNCLMSFSRAAERSGIDFPQGQKSHILRHTFASHFVMNGGNILVLQKILGHSTIAMTMRYAHLAPDHLTEVLQFGPMCSVPEFRHFSDTLPKN